MASLLSCSNEILRGICIDLQMLSRFPMRAPWTRAGRPHDSASAAAVGQAFLSCRTTLCDSAEPVNSGCPQPNEDACEQDAREPEGLGNDGVLKGFRAGGTPVY